MQRRGGEDFVSFIVHKGHEAEGADPWKAKAWLLTGKSIFNQSFPIQYEAYQLEKRLNNAEGAAHNFEQLFRRFGSHIREDIASMAQAVRICTLTPGKETPDQLFLKNVFVALPRDTQIELLIQCTEFTPALFEKCQTMLLLVKLFPETINQKNGGEMLLALLSCESDAWSTFRKLLVVELVPSVLQLSQNLEPTHQFVILLNQCIEYYVLVEDPNQIESSGQDRWGKLFNIVDQIGGVLNWAIAPFFKGLSESSVESLYQALLSGFQRRNHYTTTELAYVTVVVFLRCIVEYYSLVRKCGSAASRDKLVLVEVFLPNPPRNGRPDSTNLPVLTSVSSSFGGSQNQVVHHFLTAVKVWDMVTTLKGERLEKEFFEILYSMNSLNFQQWEVFREFNMDLHTYIGQYYQQDAVCIQNPLKLASMYCSMGNFKNAAEYCIKGVAEAIQGESIDKGVFTGSKEDFSFYSPHIYNADATGNFVYQRRVHFISENNSEILAYAVNVLLRCFYESLDVPANAKDDRCIGHLMTLLQMEWPSPPAEMLFSNCVDIVKRKGSFRYVPFFSDFIIEPDFLETFMGISIHESKAVKLELFPNTATAATTGRRIGTRGVEKGSKTEFKSSMQRQMLKNGRENLEVLLSRFLTLNKGDILTCLD